jgi:hypothetical protein
VPNILRALAKVKFDGLPAVSRKHLSSTDVIVRATAAALLRDLQSDENLEALIKALGQAQPDVMNDAKLATLTSLAKYKAPRAVGAITKALEDEDHLVRRLAVDLLRQMGAGNHDSRIGVVQTRHNQAFYDRVRSRLGKNPVAVIHTWKGEIKLELFADDAPLTVENFIEVARQGFFKRPHLPPRGPELRHPGR